MYDADVDGGTNVSISFGPSVPLSMAEPRQRPDKERGREGGGRERYGYIILDRYIGIGIGKWTKAIEIWGLPQLNRP